jgi:hypothetical protein
MHRLHIEYRESEFRRVFGQNPTRPNVMRHLRLEHVNGCSEMHVSVYADDDYEGAGIELATIEVRLLKGDEWVLQYLSQPGAGIDFTGGILPNDADFLAYLSSRRTSALQPLRPFSAEALNADGLGALDRLNLRLDTSAPVLPRNVDLARFNALVGLS